MRLRKGSAQSETCGFEKDQSNLKDAASRNWGERAGARNGQPAATDGEGIPMTIAELHQPDQLVRTKGSTLLLRGRLRQLRSKKAGPLNLESAGSGPVRIAPRGTAKVRCYFEALQKYRCQFEALQRSVPLRGTAKSSVRPRSTAKNRSRV